MLIVGELINASRKAISQAIEKQNVKIIQELAKEQFEAGANFIDVNAGVFVERESSYLEWLVTNVQSSVGAPCCIDSPNPEAIEAAISVHKGPAMINSISLEKKRLQSLLPIVAGTDLKVVALCMSDDGMPETAEQRLAIAEKLVGELVKNNVSPENIYVDPLVQPIATNSEFGREFLKAIELIVNQLEGIHTICGLSNISYGLPERKVLNQTFASMAVAKGLTGIIMNPLDKQMMANVIAAEALIGKDEFCMGYLSAYRSKKFEFESLR